jgi:RHS repeat-associated protein
VRMPQLSTSKTRQGTPSGSSALAAPADIFGYYYYLLDQNGSVRAMADTSGGIVIRYDYDAYGTQSRYDGLGPWYNRFGYVGQYRDEESELLYMRARYYDPATQQFISRDPLEGVSGQLYAYARGSPVNFSDPTGSIGRRNSMFLQTGPIDEEEPPTAGGVGRARGMFARNGEGPDAWDAGDPLTLHERKQVLEGLSAQLTQ